MPDECKDCIYIKNLSERIDINDVKISTLETDITKIKIEGAVNDVKQNQIITALSEIKHLQEKGNDNVLKIIEESKKESRVDIEKLQVDVGTIKNTPDSFQSLKNKLSENIIMIILVAAILVGGVLYAFIKNYSG